MRVKGGRGQDKWDASGAAAGSHAEKGQEEGEERGPTPLPLVRLSVLSLILLANNTSMFMILSLVPFVVQHYYPDIPVTGIGFRGGLVGSAFFIGSLFAALLWGRLSDHVGRRRVLVVGLVGTFASALFFALSPTFAMAVVARFLWGVLNGNVAVCRAYLSEVLDDSNMARGMALFGLCGSLGRTVGPALGGFLAGKAEDPYPFLLPILPVLLMCVIAAVCALVFLEETVENAQTWCEFFSTLSWVQRLRLRLRLSHRPAKRDGGERYDSLPNADDGIDTDTDTETIVEAEDDAQPPTQTKPPMPTVRELMRRPHVLYSTMLYGLNGFTAVVASELVPLWLVTSPHHGGGFEYSAKQIGLLLAMIGPICVVWQLVVYHRVVEWLGVRRTVRAAYASFIFAVTVIISLTPLARSAPIAVQWIVLLIYGSIVQVASLTSLTSIFVLINNSAWPHERGMVNGIGQTWAALGRGLGPFFAGWCFAFLVHRKHELPWPLDWHGTFYFTALATFIPLLVTYRLGDSIEKKKTEATEGEEDLGVILEEEEQEQQQQELEMATRSSPAPSPPSSPVA